MKAFLEGDFIFFLFSLKPKQPYHILHLIFGHRQILGTAYMQRLLGF